jgi:hypothetical protein
MSRYGVRRILCVGAVGMQPGRDPNLPLIGRLVMQLVFKNLRADMNLMQQQLEATELDWTMMWPPRLTDAELTGQYRVGYGGALRKGSSLARGDLAHYMVHHIADATTFGKSVAIAY